MSDVYRLHLSLAGPGFRDNTIMFSFDEDDLQPKLDGLFERYGSEDEYIEVRSEYIVIRTYSKVDLDEVPAVWKEALMRERRSNG